MKAPRTPQSGSAPLIEAAAGEFAAWLAQFRAALRGTGGSDVPCGDCVGCCVSAYSIQLRPEDWAAVARIPVEMLVTAPGFSHGSAVLPPRADGGCPMHGPGGCSIYAHRPQTCRDYDCRIFAAAGLDAGPDKPVINRRVHAWRFAYPSRRDRLAHDAVLATAAFIREHRDSFTGRVPTAPTGIAVLAIKAYMVFLDPAVHTAPAASIAVAIQRAAHEFDAGRSPDHGH